jgi:hypothetical protein
LSGPENGAREIVAAAQAGKDRITVPAAAMVEWWRGPEKGRQLIRTMFDIEPLDEDLAKRAGEALASASAARRGDVVFTSDVDDLGRFSRHFPNVRILSV